MAIHFSPSATVAPPNPTTGSHVTRPSATAAKRPRLRLRMWHALTSQDIETVEPSSLIDRARLASAFRQDQFHSICSSAGQNRLLTATPVKLEFNQLDPTISRRSIGCDLYRLLHSRYVDAETCTLSQKAQKNCYQNGNGVHNHFFRTVAQPLPKRVLNSFLTSLSKVRRRRAAH